MSTTLSATKRSFQMAKYAHDMIVKMISDFPAEKAAFQTSPTDNHLLWHLGHLAIDYHWFASALDGKPAGTTDEEKKLFGMGSKPVPDAKAYPPLSELRKRFDAGWERMAAAAESLRDEDGAKPTMIESGGFLKDRLDVVDKSAWHDGWHAGQLSGLRKALGLKGVF
jgi:hypothetical protein